MNKISFALIILNVYKVTENKYNKFTILRINCFFKLLME